MYAKVSGWKRCFNKLLQFVKLLDRNIQDTLTRMVKRSVDFLLAFSKVSCQDDSLHFINDAKLLVEMMFFKDRKI